MIFDGDVPVSEKRSIPFHYESGNLELFQGITPVSLEEGSCVIVGKKRGLMEWMLFHLSLPISNHSVFMGTPFTLANEKHEVDYIIDGYCANTKYSKLQFLFPELDYFLPSASMCIPFPADGILQFTRKAKVVKSFPFEYQGRAATFTLEILSDCEGGTKRHAETVSRLTLEFDETDDYEFILSLYRLIKFFFSFVCNRLNISLESAELYGTHRYNLDRKMPDGAAEVHENESFIASSIYVPEMYQDEPERPEVIKTTIEYCVLASAIEKLFSLITNNRVSIQSIHSSRKARSLLDLKQCLHITAAFEYYLRTFLPKISSQETIDFYEDVKAFLKGYIETQKIKKKKEKAKDLLNSISPEIPLNEMIRKVYNGYKGWKSLKPILSGYFGVDISQLADVAREWRNELAHEKREYEPSLEVVSAIRLMEHINYCIVLRQAEYSDDEIRTIVDRVLTR